MGGVPSCKAGGGPTPTAGSSGKRNIWNIMEPAFLHQAMGFSIIFRFHAASCATVTEIPSNGCLEESLLVGFHQVLPVSGSHVGFLEEFFVVPSISDWGKPRKLGEAAGPSRGVGRRGGGRHVKIKVGCYPEESMLCEQVACGTAQRAQVELENGPRRPWKAFSDLFKHRSNRLQTAS